MILTKGEIPSIVDAHGFTFIIWWQCSICHTYKYDLQGEEQPIHIWWNDKSDLPLILHP